MICFSNEHVAGYLPEFFSESDPRSAREQLHESYAHGGGVNPFNGFKLIKNSEGKHRLQYPGDPAMLEISRAWLREELIILFESAWLAIIQPSGEYLITRVD